MPSIEMEMMKNALIQMMDSGIMARFDKDITIDLARSGMKGQSVDFPGVRFESRNLDGIEAERTIHETLNENAILLYIHGGGMISGNAFSSRKIAALLANETHLLVYSISYRLAPEHHYPAGLDDCLCAYQALLRVHADKPIILVGESAGAYLSIAVTLKARDTGIKLPAALVLHSPPIDLSGTIDRDRPQNHDVMILPSGLDHLSRLYCSSIEQAKDPYISPYFADFHEFPPAFISWDENESLAPDSEILIQKLMDAGCHVETISFPDCFHTFPVIGRIAPECVQVLDAAQKFISYHCK